MQKCNKTQRSPDGKSTPCTGQIEQDGFCSVCGMSAGASIPDPKPDNSFNTTSVLSKLTAVSSVSRRLNGFSNGLGEGIVEIEPFEEIDPLSLVLDNLEVPDGKRVCQNPECFDRKELARNLAFMLRLNKDQVLVGLPRIGTNSPAFSLERMLSNIKGVDLTKEESEKVKIAFAARKPHQLIKQKGFCGECGQQYNFIPSLKKGDIVAGQYEIEGPIAFGGLGWIYLGRAIALDNKWVILKGLLNRRDEYAARVVVQEKNILSRIDHPDVVKVINFVTQKGDQPYIVMELVPGRSLKDIRKEEGPLHPANALAFIISILPAIDHFHQKGLIYCDFKLDNVMVSGDRIKIIDLGGVIEMNGNLQDIYGTAGYTAPEAGECPSISSDLYTIGRALAVMILNFDYQGRYIHSLPSDSVEPLFRKYDSLYRFLLRACAESPEKRFTTAGEMRDQALGVLRQVVSAANQSTSNRAYSSTVFSDHCLALSEFTPDIEQLPLIKLDPTDPAAESILSLGFDRFQVKQGELETLLVKHPLSLEAHLALFGYYLKKEEFDRAEKLLAGADKLLKGDWRELWYQALMDLARGRYDRAASAFDQVYEKLPGELAPQLGLALAHEARGELNRAEPFYRVVANTNPRWDSALFGLARCLTEARKNEEAETLYAEISSQSGLHDKARIKYALSLATRRDGKIDEEAYLKRVQEAMEILKGLSIAIYLRLDLYASILTPALESFKIGTLHGNELLQIDGEPFTEKGVRSCLERIYRYRARLEVEPEVRAGFIDMANAVRPFTLF